MGIEQLILIILGALAGGFVSGLAGFGTGITACLSFHLAGHIWCAARHRAALTPRYKNSQAHGRRSSVLILYIYVVWQNTCEEHMGRSLRGWCDWFRRWRSRGPCRLIGTAADDVGDDQGLGKAREPRGVSSVQSDDIEYCSALACFGGLLTAEVGWALLAAFPGTITGAWLGARANGRLDDERFRVIILLLICASGGVLIWKSI